MYVGMATRRYGEGNILIHTDMISGRHTSHGKNDAQFWRGVFELCTSKKTPDVISIAVISHIDIDETFRAVEEATGITAKRISLPYITLHGLDGFDCLYVSGLPELIDSDVLAIITSFVDHGGGLIIENPNIIGNINLLANIEDVEVTSIQPPVLTNGYWTISGKTNHIFDVGAKIGFLSELLETSFSNYWDVLITEIEVDDSIPDDYDSDVVLFDANTSSEFSISFITGMQKGQVVITES